MLLFAAHGFLPRETTVKRLTTFAQGLNWRAEGFCMNNANFLYTFKL